MPLIKWSGEHTVKTDEIDKEHEELVRMINSLHESVLTNKDCNVSNIIAEELFSYTEKHFANEAKIMLSDGFPDAVSHKGSHDKLLQQLKLLITDICTDDERKITKTPLLADWFVDHLLIEDKKYELYLIKKLAYSKNEQHGTRIDAKGTEQNKLVWSDEYSVKIKEMDEQHKKLVEIINTHSSAVNLKEERKVLEGTLTGLFEYIEVHFKREEELLLQHDYPEYKTQEEEHAYLNQEVHDLYIKYVKGDDSTAFLVASLMRHWLFNHICNEDKKYSKYLNNKGVT